MAVPPLTPTAPKRTPEEEEYYKSLPDQIGGGTGMPQIGQIQGLEGTPMGGWGGPNTAPQASGPGGARPGLQAGTGPSDPNLEHAQAGTNPQTTNLIAEAAKLTGNPPPEEQPPGGLSLYGDPQQMQGGGQQPLSVYGDPQQMMAQQAGQLPSTGNNNIESPNVMAAPGTPVNQPQLASPFSGVDPNSSYAPDQALSDLEHRAGRTLSEEERTNAIAASGWSGSGPLTGVMMNAIIQWGAQALGGTYTPWQPQTPGTGTLPTAPLPPTDPNAPHNPPGGGYEPPPTGGGGGGPTAPPPPRYPIPTPRTPSPTVPYEPYTPRPRTPIPQAAPYVAPNIPWGDPLQSNVTPPPAFHAPTRRTPAAYQAPTPFQYSDYQAPDPFHYDPYQAPANFREFEQGPEFSYADYQDIDPFKAPTLEEATNDPGYQFGVKQGTQAMEQSAAARGVLRTGGTLKDLINYGNEAATQRYGDVYNRRASEWDRTHGANRDEYLINREGAQSTYDRNTAARAQDYTLDQSAWDRNTNLGLTAYNTNRGNAADAYDRNAASGRYAYDTNRGNAAENYDRNTASGRYAHEQDVNAADSEYGAAFQGAQAEYDPVFAGWQTATAANQRTGELNFDRRHQQDLYSRDDAWRQYQFQTQNETDRQRYNDEADWQREVFGQQQNSERSRYLNDDQYRRERDANDMELQTALRASDDEWRRFVDQADRAWQRELLQEQRNEFLARLAAGQG